MGILADTEWRDNTKVTIIAKTQENFSYKIGEFDLVFIGQYGGYKPEDKTDKCMYKTRNGEFKPNHTGIVINGQNRDVNIDECSDEDEDSTNTGDNT